MRHDDLDVVPVVAGVLIWMIAVVAFVVWSEPSAESEESTVQAWEECSND